MKIHIDINHPAHVHYFRNFIKEMESDGYNFIVTNRDDQLINDLLDHYSIKHFTRGARPQNKSRFQSIKYLLSMIWSVYRIAKKEKPDFFIGFASPACAINGAIFRKPSIIIDDTEHNHLNHSIYSKFCSVIITPDFFEKGMGKKHIRIQAYIEQLYLHSKHFSSKKILKEENYALIRYISYDASHDYNVKNIASEEKKMTLVSELSKRIKVYVSTESDIEENSFYKKFKLDIHPSEIHSVIANATVFISEGATMASEAGVLGTPYYYINPLSVGYVNHQEKNYAHAHSCRINDVLKKIDSLVEEKDEKIVSEIEDSTINPTEFLIYFIKNYPKSLKSIDNRIIDKKVFDDLIR
jgi:predicted glycosyltransferase